LAKKQYTTVLGYHLTWFGPLYPAKDVIAWR